MLDVDGDVHVLSDHLEISGGSDFKATASVNLNGKLKLKKPADITKDHKIRVGCNVRPSVNVVVKGKPEVHVDDCKSQISATQFHADLTTSANATTYFNCSDVNVPTVTHTGGSLEIDTSVAVGGTMQVGNLTYMANSTGTEIIVSGNGKLNTSACETQSAYADAKVTIAPTATVNVSSSFMWSGQATAFAGFNGQVGGVLHLGKSCKAHFKPHNGKHKLHCTLRNEGSLTIDQNVTASLETGVNAVVHNMPTGSVYIDANATATASASTDVTTTFGTAGRCENEGAIEVRAAVKFGLNLINKFKAKLMTKTHSRGKGKIMLTAGSSHESGSVITPDGGAVVCTGSASHTFQVNATVESGAASLPGGEGGIHFDCPNVTVASEQFASSYVSLSGTANITASVNIPSATIVGGEVHHGKSCVCTNLTIATPNVTAPTPKLMLNNACNFTVANVKINTTAQAECGVAAAASLHVTSSFDWDGSDGSDCMFHGGRPNILGGIVALAARARGRFMARGRQTANCRLHNYGQLDYQSTINMTVDEAEVVNQPTATLNVTATATGTAIGSTAAGSSANCHFRNFGSMTVDADDDSHEFSCGANFHNHNEAFHNRGSFKCKRQARFYTNSRCFPRASLQFEGDAEVAFEEDCEVEDLGVEVQFNTPRVTVSTHKLACGYRQLRGDVIHNSRNCRAGVRAMARAHVRGGRTHMQCSCDVGEVTVAPQAAVSVSHNATTWTAGSLGLSGGCSLMINASASVTVNTTFEAGVNSTAVAQVTSYNGTAQAAGSLTLKPECNTMITGNVVVSANVTNQGTITHAPSTTTNDNGLALVNATLTNSGSITVVSGNHFCGNSTNASVENSGTVTVDLPNPGQTVSCGTHINTTATGTIRPTTGVVSLDAGSNTAGTVQGSTNGAIKCNGGTHTVTESATVSASINVTANANVTIATNKCDQNTAVYTNGGSTTFTASGVTVGKLGCSDKGSVKVTAPGDFSVTDAEFSDGDVSIAGSANLAVSGHLLFQNTRAGCGCTGKQGSLTVAAGASATITGTTSALKDVKVQVDGDAEIEGDVTVSGSAMVQVNGTLTTKDNCNVNAAADSTAPAHINTGKSGTVTVKDNKTLKCKHTRSEGKLVVGGGSTVDGDVTVEDGTMSHGGSVSGTVNHNGGKVEPAKSNGSNNGHCSCGKYKQTSNAVIHLNLDFQNGQDVLAVDQDALFAGGKIEVSITGTFSLSGLLEFVNVITYNGHAGEIASVDGGAYKLKVITGEKGVNLKVENSATGIAITGTGGDTSAASPVTVSAVLVTLVALLAMMW